MMDRGLIITVPALLFCACSSSDDGTLAQRPDAATPRPDAAAPNGDAGPVLRPDAAPPLREASHVRFKGGARLRTDWARGLDIPESEVCRELGRYDCATLVHVITLGGVEPYQLGAREPLPEAPVTAPLAIDRMALSACTRAADRDFANPDGALIFRPGDGGWTAEAQSAAWSELIDRLWFRPPGEGEVDELLPLAEEIDPATRPRDWAIASCFVVATSFESLFY